jgi:two-component system sensor histidine kinase HydH
MAQWSSTRTQTVLVVILFLGSLGTLFYNSLATFLLPQRELQIRERLREASRRMAEAAAPLAEAVPSQPGPLPQDVNRQLREVAQQVLKEYPGVEGGFYVGGDIDRFHAFAFPTSEHKKAPGKPPPREEPPPLETPLIWAQAQQSLRLPQGQYLVNVQDVETSRVAVLTEPVGAERPARLATWVMFRVSGHELLESRLQHYGLSMGLSLVGIAFALILTWNLGRTLKRQRQERDRLRDELRRAEQLAALGTLLAGVAHEVRNPLAGIRSTVQLWQRLPDLARTPGSMDAVIRAVDRINAIVSRLLFFARAESAERQAVDINQILNECLDLVQAQAADQAILLQRDLAPGLPAVRAAPNALRQVALNLVTNALQAMPAGGRLRCSTCRSPAAGTLEIRVADTGAGISEQDRTHLFEPFFTTRPDGTGLGLALCREIVHNHGGRIDLETTGPAGTTFRVLLPAET